MSQYTKSVLPECLAFLVTFFLSSKIQLSWDFKPVPIWPKLRHARRVKSWGSGAADTDMGLGARISNRRNPSSSLLLIHLPNLAPHLPLSSVAEHILVSIEARVHLLFQSVSDISPMILQLLFRHVQASREIRINKVTKIVCVRKVDLVPAPELRTTAPGT